MRTLMKAGLASFMTVLALAPAMAEQVTHGGLTIADPWARATPGGAKVGAAYLEIRATADAGDRLLEARSPVSVKVELHTHAMDDGVMRMRRVSSIDVPGGGGVSLKPGSYHVMLMGLKAPLKEGGTVPLTLVFEKAGEVAITAKIAPIGAMGPNAAAGAGGHGAHKGH